MDLLEEVKKDFGIIAKEEKDINWGIITKSMISFDLIDKYSDHIKNWNWISIIYDISEDFMEKYKDKLVWFEICKNHKLSKEFMIRMQKHLDMKCVSLYQDLDMELIERWWSLLDRKIICKRYSQDKNFIEFILNKIY